MSNQSFISQFFSFERRNPAFRKWIWRSIYDFLAWKFNTPEWTFMNYGYLDSTASNQGQTLKLEQQDEPNRYFIQLYYHLVQDLELQDKSILEVGSGRGGGSAWLARSQPLKSMTGLDLSQQAIEFCKKRYLQDGLSYIQGDAEHLPFEKDSFDIVVNLESSHHYPNFNQFLAEVYRVLRPGGLLLLADYRDAPEIEDFKDYLHNSTFEIDKEEDITANVVAALDVDDQRKQELINKNVNRLLQSSVRTFAGMSGTEVYQRFNDRRLIYLNYRLKKPSITDIITE